jgi:ribonuclease J
VHGEYRQLLAAARLAELGAAPPKSVLLAENGDLVRLAEEGARLAGRIETGRVYLDGSAGEVDWTVVRDRRTLARDGVLVPVLLLGPPGSGRPPRIELTARGFAPAGTETGFLEEAVAELQRTLASGPAATREDPGLMETTIADALKRFVRRRTGRRPLILPVLREV